jgi:hypothetical protein
LPINEPQLMFLANELINPKRMQYLNLPLQFITFAHIKGKLYKHHNRKDVFVLQEGITNQWGSSVVYGAVFLVPDYYFYVRTLDAYHTCSLSTLRKNHNNDLHHRDTVLATPIKFNSLSDWAVLLYEEKEPIAVQTYFGNPNHPKIKSRYVSTKNNRSHYRITSGVDLENYKSLYREVQL